MKVKVPYGYNALQIGCITVFTIKLRFNEATWSFIKPELDKISSDAFISKKGVYHTIEVVTTEVAKRTQALQAIHAGQIRHQEEVLKLWKQNGMRPDSRNVHYQEEVPVQARSIWDYLSI